MTLATAITSHDQALHMYKMYVGSCLVEPSPFLGRVREERSRIFKLCKTPGSHCVYEETNDPTTVVPDHHGIVPSGRRTVDLEDHLSLRAYASLFSSSF